MQLCVSWIDVYKRQSIPCPLLNIWISKNRIPVLPRLSLIHIFVTSKGTMDKQNPNVRKYIAERADAVRSGAVDPSVDNMPVSYTHLKTKFKNNVAAIRTLKEIEFDDRLATPEEQEIHPL